MQHIDQIKISVKLVSFNFLLFRKEDFFLEILIIVLVKTLVKDIYNKFIHFKKTKMKKIWFMYVQIYKFFKTDNTLKFK